MFRAAAAFDAANSLQCGELCNILARNQAEIFIAGEWRNMAEPSRFKKIVTGLRTR